MFLLKESPGQFAMPFELFYTYICVAYRFTALIRKVIADYWILGRQVNRLLVE